MLSCKGPVNQVHYVDMSKPSIILMGSPDFAVPTFEEIRHHFTIEAVFTKPDAQKGRGKKIQETAVKKWATAHKIPVFTPASKNELTQHIDTLKSKQALIIAYGIILPKSITDSIFCINVHASLLPMYRGASPIQASLLNGDSQSGITLIHMNEKMDEGNILAIDKINIKQTDNFESLHNKLMTLSKHITTFCLISTADLETLPEIKQHEKNVSYCQKIKASDRELLTTDSIENKLNKIRAFSPSPGAFTLLNNKRIKILEASIQNNRIQPIVIKPEGKATMSYHDYLLANPPFTL